MNPTIFRHIYQIIIMQHAFLFKTCWGQKSILKSQTPDSAPLPLSNTSFGRSSSGRSTPRISAHTVPTLAEDGTLEDDDLVIIPTAVIHELAEAPAKKATAKLIQRILSGSFQIENTKDSTKLIQKLDLCIQHGDLASAKRIIDAAHKQSIIVYHTPILDKIRIWFSTAKEREAVLHNQLLINEVSQSTHDINTHFGELLRVFRENAQKHITSIHDRMRKVSEIGQIAEDHDIHIQETLDTIQQLYPACTHPQQKLAHSPESDQSTQPPRTVHFLHNPTYTLFTAQAQTHIDELRKVIQKLEAITILTQPKMVTP